MSRLTSFFNIRFNKDNEQTHSPTLRKRDNNMQVFGGGQADAYKIDAHTSNPIYEL